MIKKRLKEELNKNEFLPKNVRTILISKEEAREILKLLGKN